MNAASPFGVHCSYAFTTRKRRRARIIARRARLDPRLQSHGRVHPLRKAAVRANLVRRPQHRVPARHLRERKPQRPWRRQPPREPLRRRDVVRRARRLGRVHREQLRLVPRDRVRLAHQRRRLHATRQRRQPQRPRFVADALARGTVPLCLRTRLIEKLRTMISEARRSGWLSPSRASKLFGLLGFAGVAIWGRLARACAAAIRDAAAGPSATPVADDLARALDFVEVLLGLDYQRVGSLRPHRRW